MEHKLLTSSNKPRIHEGFHYIHKEKKIGIHQKKEFDKMSVFIGNRLKAKLPLEATMHLNRKTKPRATRNPKAATKAYKTLI